MCNGVHGWVCIPRGARLGVYTTGAREAYIPRGAREAYIPRGCRKSTYHGVQEEYLPREEGGYLPREEGGYLPTMVYPRLPTHHGVYTHLHTLGIPPSRGDMLYT